MLTIDGSMDEGGGQILRIALAWSALNSEPIRIVNIRAKRPKAGLKPQHLTTLLALAEITDAEVKGAKLGSKEVEFVPNRPKGGRYIFDCGTAGSITLMVQALLPVLLHADSESEIVLRGGTDVKWSPPANHTKHVLLSVLREMGADVNMQITRRGYYPEGGGEIVLRVRPSNLNGIELMGGEPEKIEGEVHYSKLPEHIPERMKRSALKHLIGYDAKIRIEKYDTISTGTGIDLWTVGDGYAMGASALGEKGIPAERLGKSSASEMKSYIEKGAGVDVHLADQLLIYMAIAGNSRIRTTEISSHARTAMELLSMMAEVEFSIHEHEGMYVIETKG